MIESSTASLSTHLALGFLDHQPLEHMQILKHEQQMVIDFEQGLEASVSAIDIHELEYIQLCPWTWKHGLGQTIIHTSQYIFQVHFGLLLQQQRNASFLFVA